MINCYCKQSNRVICSGSSHDFMSAPALRRYKLVVIPLLPKLLFCSNLDVVVAQLPVTTVAKLMHATVNFKLKRKRRGIVSIAHVNEYGCATLHPQRAVLVNGLRSAAGRRRPSSSTSLAAGSCNKTAVVGTCRYF